MTVEEALEIAQSVLEQGHLSKVQEIVFGNLGKTVSERLPAALAMLVGVRDVGSKLWQSLKGIWEEGHQITKESWSMLHVVFAEEWRQAKEVFLAC